MTYPPWLLQLKPASAEALAFGGLWAFLLDAALVGIVLTFAIDAYAPPQDLPWKPLRLDDPPGLATAVKFQRAAADPDLCREVLAAGGRPDLGVILAPEILLPLLGLAALSLLGVWWRKRKRDA